MSNVDACLSPAELRAYLDGLRDDSRAQWIESHLSTCRVCEETLLALEEESDTLVRRLRDRTPHWDNQPPLDPMLREVLDASRRLVGQSSRPAVALAADWMPPTGVVGPYTLQRPIGTGGMGIVYLARHRELGKQVAIKLLPAVLDQDDLRIERFLREIRAAGSLEHPSIVNATDAGMDGGIHYLAMEYIDGFDVSQVARVVQLSVADACEIVRQAALGLAYAHAEGVVHRDIKPSNLMLRRDGEVKILDFGLAQISSWDGALAELTTVGQLMGTLDYMSPEQAEQPGKVDYRTDLYSLGATLFRLICGRAPLAAAPNLTPLAKLRLLANHRAPKLDTLRPGLPPALVALTAGMLAASPDDRPASAAHVAEALAEFTSGSDLAALVQEASCKLPAKPIDQSPTGPITSAACSGFDPPATRRRWWIAATMLPLIVIAVVTITLQTNTGQLVIESEVADVSIQLVQEGETTNEINVASGATATRLKSGSYQIVLGAGSDSVSVDQGTLEIRRGQTTIARLRRTDAADDLLSPKLSVNRTSVYEGQTLENWLTVIQTERESVRLEKALTAISHLATPADQARITEVLIANQQRLLHRELFSILQRNIPSDDLADFFVAQLAKGEVAWQKRILEHVGRSNIDLKTLAQVDEWLFANVFVAGGSDSLMRDSLGVAMQLAADTRLDIEQRQRRIDRLRALSIAEEPIIPARYWLELWRGKALDAWVSELMIDVCAQQISDNKTSLTDLSAAIAVLRYQIKQHLDLAWKVQQNEPLLNAIQNRIMAIDRLNWSNASPADEQAYLLRPGFEYQFSQLDRNSRLYRNIGYTKGSFLHVDPVLELLQLAILLPLSDASKTRLTQLREQTQAGLDQAKEFLDNPYLELVMLDWDSLTVKEVRWLEGAEFRRPLGTERLPSGQDWFDAYVNLQVTELLDRSSIENKPSE